MTTISRRTTYRLSALVAALLWTTASTSVSGQDGQGIHLTRNGFRTLLYGVSQTHDANGNVTAECAALTAPQVDAARVGRRVSRSMMASSPQTVVRGPEGGATFDVTYTDAQGAGFNDSMNGATRRRAFEAALSVWSKVIRAEQPIKVEATMHPMDDGDNNPLTTLLAFAKPTEFWIIENRAVPSPLAWQLINGRFSNATDSDITVEVNDRADWDYSLTGETPPQNRSSFLYTMMHELAHGLGLVDSFDGATGRLLNDPVPLVYDVFVNRGASRRNLVIDHAAEERVRDLKSRDLFFNGESAAEASRQSARPLQMLKLYAPDPFRRGASVSHVDQETYEGIRNGTDIRTGLIMTPLVGLGSGDTIHVLTQATIKDIGYTLMPPPATNSSPTVVRPSSPK